MKTIRDQYRALVRWVIGIVVLLQIIVVNAIVPSCPQFIQKLYHAVGDPSMAAIGAVVILSYEKWLWKIINPAFDFSGRWEVKDSFYAPTRTKDVKRQDRLTVGTITIVQTPWSIGVVEGNTRLADDQEGANYSTMWHSTSCELKEDACTIYASLEMTRSYKDRANAPSATRAYETIEVKERDEFGRPALMYGMTYHCIDAGVTAWVGESIYKRIPRRARLAVFTAVLTRILSVRSRPKAALEESSAGSK